VWLSELDGTYSAQQRAAAPTYRLRHSPTLVRLPTHVAEWETRGTARLEGLAESACQDRMRSIRVDRVEPAKRISGNCETSP
jgi:hypothetical protein